MATIDWKDVWVRSLKTFLETFFAVIVQDLAGINLFDGSLTKVALVGMVLSGLAAAITAAWNGVLEPLFAKPKPPETTL